MNLETASLIQLVRSEKQNSLSFSTFTGILLLWILGQVFHNFSGSSLRNTQEGEFLALPEFLLDFSNTRMIEKALTIFTRKARMKSSEALFEGAINVFNIISKTSQEVPRELY